MSPLNGLSATVLIIGSLFARPVAAQSSDDSRSLTHVVSVSVPARVKVSVSSVAPVSGSTGSESAVPKTLTLNVDANQPWALSISAPDGSPDASFGSSETRSGQFTAVVNTDEDTASSTASGQPVVLTVSAP